MSDHAYRPEDPAGRTADNYDDDRGHIVPARVQTFGMWIFLLGLTILFGSAMLVYVLIRTQSQEMPPPGALRHYMTSPLLFVSTVIVLAASVTVHLAVRQVRFERGRSFLRWLVATDLLALAFLAVQTPAMIMLLGSDLGAGELASGGARDTRLYGILFVYVLLHALHVVGGVIYLGIVTRRAMAGRYDHEHFTGVKHAAMYWHFLDLIWLLMFGTFLVLG